LRLRIERKIRKRLRCFRPGTAGRDVALYVRQQEREGLLLGPALRAIATRTDAGWMARGEAAKLLALAEHETATVILLTQFFAQETKTELWETALALEWLGDKRTVIPLAQALGDANVHRRHAAARALGWIPYAGGDAVTALAVTAMMRALDDPSQPVAVRAEAAESLAYLDSRRAIPVLLTALADPDVNIRFWAVFALGSIHKLRPDPRIPPALVTMLPDPATPDGGWWPVGREAFAILGDLEPPDGIYRQRLSGEIQRVFQDPGASPEELRWAEFYNESNGRARLS
jgi:HEAT repeat protein